MRRARFAVAGFLLAASCAAAESDAPRSLFSSSRRFLAQGFPAEEALLLFREADDVFRRLEDIVPGLRFGRGEYIELIASGGDEVTRAQGFADGVFVQQLSVPRGCMPPDADLRDGLVWLLLNRALDPPGKRDARNPVTVPDWLACGVARHMYAERRQPALAAALGRWEAGTLSPLRALMDREIFPSGPWAEKEDAALVVRWLLPSMSSSLWEALGAELAAGRRLSPSWLAGRLGLPTQQALSAAWEVWVAARHEEQRPRAAGPRADLFDTLRGFECAERAELLALGAPPDTPLEVEAWIAVRDVEVWVAAATGRQRALLQRWLVRQDDMVQAAGALYVDFFEALAGCMPGYTGGLLGRRGSSRQLAELLARARAAAARGRTEAAGVSALLDRVEAEADAGSPDERAAVSAWLDEWERAGPLPDQ